MRPLRRGVPAWRRGMYFADIERAGRVVYGDQFLLTAGGVVGFLDGRRHLSLVESAPLVAWALLDGVALAPGEVTVPWSSSTRFSPELKMRSGAGDLAVWAG